MIVEFHPEHARRLAALEARLREDLALLNHPAPNWVPETRGACDVAVVGGGMCGLVAGFALLRAGIRRVRILDRSAEGLEGPWMTYARMETLRSPKQLLGPAYGMASLTFQAWYRATHGDPAWEALYRIPRPLWMEYLRWYRRVLALPVENGISVSRVGPAEGDLLELEIDGGRAPSILARRVVLANGREGLGHPTVPAFAAALPRERWAHSSDDIDFAALRGRRVAVIGVGASAMDNAATALEAGAAEVRLLARRKVMPTVNKLMGVGSYGLVAGFPTLSPAWRWRIMRYAGQQQTPAPSNSTRRVGRHPNGFFHFGCAIRRTGVEEGEIRIDTEDGRVFGTDFVILGTGFTVDATARPELQPHTARIAAWRDRYEPPADERDPELAGFPWLADDFSFTEKAPGAAPWLARVHCFNYGATMSLGKVSGDIPAISEGAAWLARGIAAAFFRDDIEAHWQALLAYAKPELAGDEWRDADALPRAEAI
jgi:FAD-dependent urate hydroxylase